MQATTIISTPTLAKASFGALVYVLSQTAAVAEYYGLPSGRSANIESAPDTSVEVGYVTGDLDEVGYTYIGGRFNYKFAPQAQVFFDFGKTDFDELEGIDAQGFGIGVFYQLDGITESADFAVKATYHQTELEDDFGNTLDTDIISVEALFSGTQIGTSDLAWYANVGMHKFDVADLDDTEFGFGAGVIKAVGFGEVYFGADMIDELTFGGGARFHF